MKKKLKFRIKNSESEKGFTLIELLIVVVIIGILATLLMTNFVGIRQRGRDAQRKSDLRQIQASLELYRADQGKYPDTVPSCNSPLEVASSVYMQKIPCDPFAPTDPYYYNYITLDNGTTYSITACLENLNDPQKDDPNNGQCDGSNNTSFTLQSP
jgi:general secretion pathway protein G